MVDARAIAWHVFLPEPTNYVTIGCSNQLTAALASASSSGAPLTLVTERMQDESDDVDYNAAVWINTTPNDTHLQRFAPESVRRFAALPSLADARWYIPLDSPQYAAASLDLISPFRIRARLLKVFLHASARLGLLHRFRDRITIASRTSSRLDQFLVGIFGEQLGSVALAPGRFGDERKVIALALDRKAARLAFVKIGLTPAAHDALANESAWLERLSRTSLERTVPRLLGFHQHGTQTFVAISPGPDRSGPVKLTPLHLDWLRAFQQLDQRNATFADSATEYRFQFLWPRIHTSVTEKWQRRIDRTISSIRCDLGKHTLKLTPAHGDFAPWNTRMGTSGRLFVFDWEYARSDCLPLYDVTHFQFMKSITLEGGVSPADVLRWLQKRVMPHAEPDLPVSLIPVLLRAYLADLALHHLAGMATRGLQDDDLVLSAVTPLLDEQSRWWEGER